MGKLLAVVLLAVPALAGGAEEFAKELDALQKLGRAGRWNVVARKLPALLEEHKGAEYARARCAAIVDLAKRSAFRAKHPPPEPKSVVKGTLLAWNPKTRKLKVHYERKQMENWLKGEQFWVHPAIFTGPHTITIDGTYPKSDSPHAFVCGDDGRDIYVVFGLNGTRKQLPARILYREKNKTLDEVMRDESLCTDTSNFPVRIVVKNSAVLATRGNRRMLSMRKKPDQWGRFGFLADDSIESVTLEGPIEPSWMQGLLDKAETKQRKDFEFDFDPYEHLPEWLFDTPDTGADLAQPDLRMWPGQPTEQGLAAAMKVLELYNEGRFADGLALAPRCGPDEALVAFLKAIGLTGQADHAKALPCARRVSALDPDFVPARELEARLLMHLGKGDDAVGVYQALLEKYPGGAELHGNAAVLLLQMDRRQDAGQVLERARINDLSSPTLDQVQTLVTKATNGPTWPRAYEHKSRHYHVVTDIDKKTCVAAAKTLEKAYVLYTVRLDRVKDIDERRFKVYLFSGREGYLKYTEDLLGKPSQTSAGLYHTLLKQFLIWNLPAREEMMRTVRHEGFHQYLDRVMGDPPIWFNEGLAEYYEIANVVRGQWRLGDPNPDHLAVLKDLMPLEEFLYRDQVSFMKRAREHYAQAWAFIRFLRHSTRENEQLFDRFWEAFKAIPSDRAALDHALQGVDLKALEAAFRAHVAALREQ